MISHNLSISSSYQTAACMWVFVCHHDVWIHVVMRTMTLRCFSTDEMLAFLSECSLALYLSESSCRFVRVKAGETGPVSQHSDYSFFFFEESWKASNMKRGDNISNVLWKWLHAEFWRKMSLMYNWVLNSGWDVTEWILVNCTVCGGWGWLVWVPQCGWFTGWW